MCLNAGLDSAASLATDFEFNLIGGVDEDTISFAADPQRNVLVCLVTGSSTIGIPKLNCLSNLVESPESLSKTMDGLAYAKSGLCENIMLDFAHISSDHLVGRRWGVGKSHTFVEQRSELFSVCTFEVNLEFMCIRLDSC